MMIDIKKMMGGNFKFNPLATNKKPTTGEIHIQKIKSNQYQVTKFVRHDNKLVGGDTGFSKTLASAKKTASDYVSYDPDIKFKIKLLRGINK